MKADETRQLEAESAFVSSSTSLVVVPPLRTDGGGEEVSALLIDALNLSPSRIFHLVHRCDEEHSTQMIVEHACELQGAMGGKLETRAWGFTPAALMSLAAMYERNTRCGERAAAQADLE